MMFQGRGRLGDTGTALNSGGMTPTQIQAGCQLVASRPVGSLSANDALFQATYCGTTPVPNATGLCPTGQQQTTAGSCVPNTFIGGAETWMAPYSGLLAAGMAVTNPSVGFSSANLQYTLGVLAVPALLVFLVMSMGKK